GPDDAGDGRFRLRDGAPQGRAGTPAARRRAHVQGHHARGPAPAHRLRRAHPAKGRRQPRDHPHRDPFVVEDHSDGARKREGDVMPKILLVEDNEMNRDMLSRRLQKKGYEVVMAFDGGAGVELARKELPDLILMDMSLPVMDG